METLFEFPSCVSLAANRVTELFGVSAFTSAASSSSVRPVALPLKGEGGERANHFYAIIMNRDPIARTDRTRSRKQKQILIASW